MVTTVSVPVRQAEGPPERVVLMLTPDGELGYSVRCVGCNAWTLIGSSEDAAQALYAYTHFITCKTHRVARSQREKEWLALLLAGVGIPERWILDRVSGKVAREQRWRMWRRFQQRLQYVGFTLAEFDTTDGAENETLWYIPGVLSVGND